MEWFLRGKKMIRKSSFIKLFLIFILAASLNVYSQTFPTNFFIDYEIKQLDQDGGILKVVFTQDKNLYSFKLMDGSTVTWKEKIRAHIKPENIDNAYTYIRDQGAGDLIKNEVSFSFGRGQDNQAQYIKEMFRKEGLEPSEKEGIQWNTLDAWVRESLQKAAEKGEPFPEETFGVFRTNDVTIKT